MSNRINSQLIKGFKLELGGTSGYGPPFAPADLILRGSTIGANDAALLLEGNFNAQSLTVVSDADVGGNLTVQGDLTVIGTTTLKVTEVQQSQSAEFLGSTTIGDASDITGPSGDTLAVFSPTTFRGSSIVIRSATPALSPVTINLDAPTGAISAKSLTLLGSVGTHREGVLSTFTTNATPTEMGSAGSFLTLVSGSVHSYSVVITAKGTAGANSGKALCLRFDLMVRNTAGTITIVGLVLETEVSSDAGLPWAVDFVPDNPNQRIGVFVTGDAATSITWVGRVSETAI